MDRGACWTTVHGVTKSQTQLSMKDHVALGWRRVHPPCTLLGLTVWGPVNSADKREDNKKKKKKQAEVINVCMEHIYGKMRDE